MRRVSLTVDVEQDCPPLLNTMRGVEEGLPELLRLFGEEGVKATFFVTGRVAEHHPREVGRIVEQGHELGCHGYDHERYDRIGAVEAQRAVVRATDILRGFGSEVVSFRAPNLKLPPAFLGVLEEQGYRVDSSIASYRPPFPRGVVVAGRILRVPASLTSSLLRLPLRVVLPIMCRIREPVLFVHPWEFVDMRAEKVRIDCRFNTGEGALRNLKGIIRHFKLRGYRFVTVREMAEPWRKH